MKKFIRIGVDLGKKYFHIYALMSEAGEAVERKVTRAGLFKFFSSAEPCLVGMEACGAAHYFARELSKIGFDIKLMPPAYVKPYVKRGKNDALDAAACCEAVSRPAMRFVPVKSCEQQAILMLHKTREQFVKQRTMNINALRGHLAEFGIIAAKGAWRVEELFEKALNDAFLPAPAKLAAKQIMVQFKALDQSIDALGQEIASHCAQNESCQLLDGIPGVGVLTASAIVATLPQPSAFKSARDFSAFLGLTPRQNSTGGKEALGSITKRQPLHSKAPGCWRDLVA